MPSSPGRSTFTRTFVSSTSIVAWTESPSALTFEVELVAGPAGFDACAAGNVLLEPVDIVGDASPRLVLAELVGQVDFDGM